MKQFPFTQLMDWYHGHRRVLPWRENPTLYRVWISEIMLQQTQVKTVIPYFDRWIERFPNVSELGLATPNEVLKYWSGLGYYRRAHLIHRAAQKILADGGFPLTLEGWLQIPGVGRYTAGAILSIALNRPEAILDGNVERVLSRLYGIVLKDHLWQEAEQRVWESFQKGISPRDFNQALMELGATICTFSRPQCLQCPLRGSCFAQRRKMQGELPKTKPEKNWLDLQEDVACIFRSDGKCLLHRDSSSRWRKGLWDFPQTEKAREVLGDLGQEGKSIQTKLIVTRHRIQRKARVFEFHERGQRLQGASEDWRWVNLQEIEDLPKGASLVKTIGRLSFKG